MGRGKEIEGVAGSRSIVFEKNVEVCTAQKSTQGSFGWRRRRRRKRVKLADISTWLCPIDQLRSIGTKFHEEIGKYGACGGVQGRVCSALQCAHAMGWKGHVHVRTKLTYVSTYVSTRKGSRIWLVARGRPSSYTRRATPWAQDSSLFSDNSRTQKWKARWILHQKKQTTIGIFSFKVVFQQLAELDQFWIHHVCG